jgi:hypothetical protein
VSADIVNLRLARKRRNRLANDEEAARNRLTHGEAKAASKLRRRVAEKAARDLEAHRRETAGTSPSRPRSGEDAD